MMMQSLTAEDVMVTDVITDHDDATISELVSILTEHMITGAPVLDASGKLVGVVSATDVARASGERISRIRREAPADYYTRDLDVWDYEHGFHVIEDERGRLVREIMTPVTFWVSRSATWEEIADTMIARRVHRLVVKDGDRIAGIRPAQPDLSPGLSPGQRAGFGARRTCS